MEGAIEIKISENHQPKAGVFLSMMHSPKRQVIKISNIYIHTHTYVTHICMCAYKYLQSFIYVNIVFRKEDMW